jgi:hypothetical protein
MCHLACTKQPTLDALLKLSLPLPQQLHRLLRCLVTRSGTTPTASNAPSSAACSSREALDGEEELLHVDCSDPELLPVLFS